MVQMVRTPILQNISNKVHNPVRIASSKGFSLIEMMVVLMLIGLLIGMVAPRFSRRSASSEWKNIVDAMNNAVQFARQESIAEQAVFRLVFSRAKKNKGPDAVVIEHVVNTDGVGKKEFAQASSPYMKTRYEFAENVHIKAIYLTKQDMFLEDGLAFCYIVPEGLVQPVYIQLMRGEDGKEEGVTLKMLPFDGNFELIEKLVRPGQEGA